VLRRLLGVVLGAVFLVPSSAGAAAGATDRTLRGQVTAEQVAAELRETGEAHVSDATVTGTVEYPDSAGSLTMENVVLTGGLEGRTEEGVLPGQVLRPRALSFTHVEFQQPLDLYLAEITSFECYDCVFEQRVNLHSVRATESVVLYHSTFRDRLTFIDLTAEYIQIYESDLQKGALAWGADAPRWNLVRILTGEPIGIAWRQFGHIWLDDKASWASAGFDSLDRSSRATQAEGELRFWRQNFDALGRREDSREVNRELILFRQEQVLPTFSFEWIATWLLDWPSAYGTRPYRPLWVSALLILLFGAFYWRRDVLDPQPDSTLRRAGMALSCSLDAFFPVVSVTNFKESGHKVKPVWHHVVSIERVVGFLLTALSAYSVTSYVL
jgi:hypothetical protein